MGAWGSIVVDFGATPTASAATATVTAQAGILATSAIEAWMDCRNASADHTAVEHATENLKVNAYNIVPGVGFDVYLEPTLGTSFGKWNVFWVWTN